MNKDGTVSLCLSQSGDGSCVPEASVVMHMTVEDFVTLIHNYIQVCAFAEHESEMHLNWMASFLSCVRKFWKATLEILEINPRCNITLSTIVLGINHKWLHESDAAKWAKRLSRWYLFQGWGSSVPQWQKCINVSYPLVNNVPRVLLCKQQHAAYPPHFLALQLIRASQNDSFSGEQLLTVRADWVGGSAHCFPLQLKRWLKKRFGKGVAGAVACSLSAG